MLAESNSGVEISTSIRTKKFTAVNRNPRASRVWMFVTGVTSMTGGNGLREENLSDAVVSTDFTPQF
jgi:hypothetical protein